MQRGMRKRGKGWGSGGEGVMNMFTILIVVVSWNKQYQKLLHRTPEIPAVYCMSIIPQ